MNLTTQKQVQIELACRILNALPDGSVETKFLTSGRLRCGPVAALNLRNAIDAALKMLGTAATSTGGDSEIELMACGWEKQLAQSQSDPERFLD